MHGPDFHAIWRQAADRQHETGDIRLHDCGHAGTSAAGGRPVIRRSVAAQGHSETSSLVGRLDDELLGVDA